MPYAVATPTVLPYYLMRGSLRVGNLARRLAWPTGMIVKEVGSGEHLIQATGKRYEFTQEDKDAQDWVFYKRGTGNGAY